MLLPLLVQLLLSTTLLVSGSSTATTPRVVTSFVRLSASGVTVDSAFNLFVTTGDCRLYKVTPAGVATLVAGAGTCSDALYRPGHVAVDSAGNAYVVCPIMGYVLKITPAGFMTTFSASLVDSNNAKASISAPAGIAIDSNDTMCVCSAFPFGPSAYLLVVAARWPSIKICNFYDACARAPGI